jgi:DNA-directed RNA polymerase subunit RPC12/RpoP
MLIRCALCDKEFNLNEVCSDDFMPDIGWACKECWEEIPKAPEIKEDLEEV